MVTSKLKKVNKVKIIKKDGFTIKVRSRHPSHDVLRGKLGRLPFESVVRFGSTTPYSGKITECNSVEAVKNSSSKLRMKQCFTKMNVKTAEWWTYNKSNETFYKNGELKITCDINKLPYPIIAKSLFGSRGRGNYKLDNASSLKTWLSGKDTSNYIFEKFYNYNREYRLHIDSEGCFYTCRKMLKEGTPPENKWFRNDSNCVWIVEDNPSFDKPINWKDIEEQCVLALKAVGLDFGACDVRVQSAKDENGKVKSPDFVIIEINSAPSFGEITASKYLKQIPIILTRKNSSEKK